GVWRRHPLRAAARLRAHPVRRRALGDRLRPQARAPELLLGRAWRCQHDAAGRVHGHRGAQHRARHGRGHHRDEDHLHAGRARQAGRQGAADAPHQHHGVHRVQHLRRTGAGLRPRHGHVQVRPAPAHRAQECQSTERHLHRL
ncbi:MAG: Thioesterase, partial [uncultured Ramlibacter sp.]